MGSTAEVDESKLTSSKVEPDDLEEDTLQLPEQEEEDLNRIKEESRRRRETIMEKYKKQHQQVEAVVRNEGKGGALNEHAIDNPEEIASMVDDVQIELGTPIPPILLIYYRFEVSAARGIKLGLTFFFSRLVVVANDPCLELMKEGGDRGVARVEEEELLGGDDGLDVLQVDNDGPLMAQNVRVSKQCFF
ncbi:hypothetical protein JHK85_016304 [Glycine max]|nr:hypothetical protein JHK87_015855 [Glycine soja]KAG5032322.1 hypothetical protein JHK85_016304 [Glycine max]